MKLLFIFALLIGCLFAGACYQESANVSTFCGGLDTGSYSLGFWEGITNPERAYDGDWETYADDFPLDTQKFMNVTYTIPSGVSGATWEVLYALNDTTWFDRNLSLNTTYCNKSTTAYYLLVNVYPNETAGYFSLSCMQTAGNWATLYALGNPSNISNFSFAEEAIYWEIDDYHPEGIFYEDGVYWGITSETPGTTMNPLILVILTAGAILLAIFPIAKIMDLI